MVLTGWCLYLRQKGPERIMISMPQVQSIRRLRRNGESVASIARKTHVSEPTVRKYLAKEDLSAVPSVRKPRASVIDPYLPVIEQWLAEDRANWRKQRLCQRFSFTLHVFLHKFRFIELIIPHHPSRFHFHTQKSPLSAPHRCRQGTCRFRQSNGSASPRSRVHPSAAH